MFRVSQHPSSGVLKNVNASGTGRKIGTATSLQRGPIGTPDRATCLRCLRDIDHERTEITETHRRILFGLSMSILSADYFGLLS